MVRRIAIAALLGVVTTAVIVILPSTPAEATRRTSRPPAQR
jgi:hypothetical protein